MEMTDVHPDWDAFTPTEESREIVTTTREHFASLDATRTPGQGGHDRRETIWTALVEQGYPLIGVPEELDGIGRISDLIAVLEEAGRALLPVPLTMTAATVQTVLAVSLPLDEIADAPSALAFTTAGSLFAFDGATARTVVSVEEDAGATIVRHLRVAPHAIRPEARPIDPSRSGAFVPESELLAERRVAASIDHVLAAARTCIAADLVGTAARALDGAVAHALMREQFGRAIGSFQAVKHRLADLHVEIERARSLAVGAAVELEADPLGDRSRLLSMMAKAAASEAGTHAAAVHTQLLGAMGLTAEADSPREVRRARHTAPFLGDARELYARVAQDTLKGTQR